MSAFLDDITACLQCGGELGAKGVSRGLCARCYRRHAKAGDLKLRFPLRPRPAVEDPEPAGAPRDHAFMSWVDVSWQIDSLCAEVDSEIFFPEKGGSTREAKSICADCLVRAECLQYALETGQRHGIWGGRSERERRRLLGLPEDDAEEASAA